MMLTLSQIRTLITALTGLILLVGLSSVLLFTIVFPVPDDESAKPVDHNWERSPIALKPALLNKQQFHGQVLFTNNCAQCHAVTKEVVVGPGLLGVTTRTPDKAWLFKWIRNSQTVVASGDAYAVALYKSFNKVAMPGFPGLSDEEINAILAYVDGAATPRPGVSGR